MQVRVLLVFLAGVLMAASGTAAETDDFYDRSLPQNPKEIRVAPYRGVRYEAEVPDTLDLAEYAGNTINFLTRLISPAETDFSIYHFIHFGTEPAILEVGHGALLAQNAKWAEAIVLMRAVSGSTLNAQEDAKLVGSLVRITGKDGLCYQPVENRPWAFIDPVTQKANRPFADMFCEGRQLLAYARWYAHDRSAFWDQLARRKIDRLGELAVSSGAGRCFRRTRGYSPSYKETGVGPVVALGDAGQVFPAMTGDGAAYVVCWNPQALSVWNGVAPYEPAMRLAGGLARYLRRDGGFYDIKEQKFPTLKSGHPTVFTHSMNSMLSYALAVRDRELIAWCRRGVDQWVALRDPGKTGIVLSTEACQIADMLQAGLMLSRAGEGDYWEDVDRWLRNSLAVLQVTPADVATWKSRPVTRAGDPNTTVKLTSYAFHQPGEIPLNRPLPPWLHQPDDATDRCLGGWYATLEKPGMIGCCNGNMSRALYYAYDSIMESSEQRLTVNLLLNRASPWGNLDSYIPYEGKAVLRMKVPQDEVLIRIPQWADATKVSLSVGGKARVVEWSREHPRYLRVGPVAGGVEVVVRFPIEEQEALVDLPVSKLVTPTGHKPCRVTLKGNTVVALSEKVLYPLEGQRRYLDHKAGTRKVSRFVSEERFRW